MVKVQFSNYQAKALGEFVSALMKAEMAFEVRALIDGWEVLVTGY